MTRKLPVGRHDPNEMKFEVSEAGTRLATFHFAEDAAVLVAYHSAPCNPTGMEIRYRATPNDEPFLVWVEGYEDQVASESTDFVASVVWDRVRKQQRSKTK
jgi:hypothetical protein